MVEVEREGVRGEGEGYFRCHDGWCDGMGVEILWKRLDESR